MHVQNQAKKRSKRSSRKAKETPTTKGSVGSKDEFIGDCFEASYRYFMSHHFIPGRENLRLVHGEVAGTGEMTIGLTFAHAWLEEGDVVHNVANGRHMVIPKDTYYRLGKIQEINNFVVYDRAMVLERVFEYEHYGPWEWDSRSGL